LALHLGAVSSLRLDAMQGQVGVAVIRENVSVAVTGSKPLVPLVLLLQKATTASGVGYLARALLVHFTLRTEQNVPTTGLEATGFVDSVTVVEGTGITVTLTASLLGTASVNGVTVVINAYAPATGLEVLEVSAVSRSSKAQALM
jgi:hypothetical protein